MATKEQKSRPGKAEPISETTGLWKKLNDFGERHAKVIITVSALLLVATVALFAKVFYDRTLPERAAKEIAQAGGSPEKLRELKEKYKGTAIEAEIVYRLANRYYEENRLDDAKREYEDFRSRFPNHPLWKQVSDAYSTLVRNKKFLEEEREFRLKTRTLLTHPEDRRRPEDLEQLRSLIATFPSETVQKLATAPLFYGPERLENPVLEFEIEGKRPFTVELFENDAPNTVYNFVKRAEQKEWDGLAFEKSGDTLRLSKKSDHYLQLEKNDREARQFCLFLRKATDADRAAGAEFEILLSPQPDLKDIVVFGEVTDGSPVLYELGAESKVKSVTVKKRRASTKYEPEVLQP